MKLPRVLGLDLDGTIINQGQPVDQRIIHAIIHSNFDKKILATARALRGVKKVAGDLLSFCDLILCNGAITIQGKEIKMHGVIDSNFVKDFSVYLIGKNIAFYLDNNVEIYIHDTKGVFKEIARYPDARKIRNSDLDYISRSSIVKIVCETIDDRHLLSKIGEYSYFFHSDGTFDIVAPGIDKYAAIRSFFDTEIELYYMGNDRNDYLSLISADRAVVVGRDLSEIDNLPDITRIGEWEANKIADQITAWGKPV